MMVIRWLIGFFPALVRLWDQTEWFYYAKTGFPPKTPAFQRWDIYVKTEPKTPDTDAERLLPLTNRLVILKDMFMQTPDEVLFFTTEADKVDKLVEEYRRELRTRTAGDFYYRMVKGRNLDFFHVYTGAKEPLIEGTEIDEEQAREKFLR
jgi:hypothetical protein